jgi:hypothetical protein
MDKWWIKRLLLNFLKNDGKMFKYSKRFDIWEAIFAVKNDGMSARNSYIQM